LPHPVGPKKIKKTSQTLLRLFRDPHRSRPPTQRTQTAGTSGRLAQLVERLVYTEDVGGSSPSSPTIFPFFYFDLVAVVRRSCAMLACRLSVRGSACGPLTLPPLCSADLSPRGEGINWRCGILSSFVCHRKRYRLSAPLRPRENRRARRVSLLPHREKVPAGG
jgi:hypothetical protein